MNATEEPRRAKQNRSTGRSRSLEDFVPVARNETSAHTDRSLLHRRPSARRTQRLNQEQPNAMHLKRSNGGLLVTIKTGEYKREDI